MANEQDTSTHSNNLATVLSKIHLTPLIVNLNGTNNYQEFAFKGRKDFDVAGYWKYVGGPEYSKPVISDLVPATRQLGRLDNGEEHVFTNEAAVEAARKEHKSWFEGDQTVLALIIKAVLGTHLHIIHSCKSSKTVWDALQKKFAPINLITAIALKQFIVSNKCGSDIPTWLDKMEQAWDNLQLANPKMITHGEYAGHIVTLMTDDPEWQSAKDNVM
jgi:hypothetical protein